MPYDFKLGPETVWAILVPVIAAGAAYITQAVQNADPQAVFADPVAWILLVVGGLARPLLGAFFDAIGRLRSGLGG